VASLDEPETVALGQELHSHRRESRAGALIGMAPEDLPKVDGRG
jgi:hypothetical protein